MCNNGCYVNRSIGVTQQHSGPVGKRAHFCHFMTEIMYQILNYNNYNNVLLCLCQLSHLGRPISIRDPNGVEQ